MKRFITIFLVLILLLSLCSCGLFSKKRSDGKVPTGEQTETGDDQTKDDPTETDPQPGELDWENVTDQQTEDKTDENNTSSGNGGGLHVGGTQENEIVDSELEPDMNSDQEGLNVSADPSQPGQFGGLISPSKPQN